MHRDEIIKLLKRILTALEKAPTRPRSETQGSCSTCRGSKLDPGVCLGCGEPLPCRHDCPAGIGRPPKGTPCPECCTSSERPFAVLPWSTSTRTKIVPPPWKTLRAFVDGLAESYQGGPGQPPPDAQRIQRFMVALEDERVSSALSWGVPYTEIGEPK